MVPRFNAENRLTPEDEFFCDLPPPTPRKHFIENIPTGLPEAGSSQAHRALAWGVHGLQD